MKKYNLHIYGVRKEVRINPDGTKTKIRRLILTKMKNEIIKVRLTESERKMIEELARAKGRTISQQIREMIYKEYENYHLFDPVPPEDIDKA